MRPIDTLGDSLFVLPDMCARGVLDGAWPNEKEFEP